ncbi:putative serine-rich protein 13-like [Capsicum chacoense]
MEMECHGEKNKRSFSYNIGDQKLRLIDISSEEDCLIDSPLFDSLEDLRLSVTWDNINENGQSSNLSRTAAKKDKSTQVNQQNELKHLSAASIQPGRPSYLRESSAWDNAFFTSAGLLDPYELSSMNKELDTLEDHPLPFILEDVHARRRVLPSISTIGTGSRDMIDHGLVSKRKNINDARADRSKTQKPSKRTECDSLEHKLPKVPRASKSASTWQSKLLSPHTYSVDIGCRKRTGPGRDLMVTNSTAHSSITSCPLYETSAYSRKRGETGKTKHSASDSRSKTPIRSSAKSKKFESLSSSMQIHHSSNKSPTSTTNAWSLESSSSTSSTNQAHNDSNRCLNITFGPTRNLWSPSQLTRPVASVPRENSQPSSLRMPSPKFGFFDEDMSVVRTFDGNSSQSQKPRISACIDDKGQNAEASTKVKRARSPLCTVNVSGDSMKTRLITSSRINHRYAASLHKEKTASYGASDMRKDGFDVQFKYLTDKSIEIDRKACSKLRKVGAGEHDRKKVGLVNGIVKTKVEREKMATKDDKGISTGTTIITPRSQAIRGRLYESSQSMSLHFTPQSQANRGRLYESSQSMSLRLTPSRNKGTTSTSKSRKQENEVNDLSRYLELIDLNDGTKTQLKQRKEFFSYENSIG